MRGTKPVSSKAYMLFSMSAQRNEHPRLWPLAESSSTLQPSPPTLALATVEKIESKKSS
jgi:hypothetical protein